MKNNNSYDPQECDELVRQADHLLEPDGDIDLSEFSPPLSEPEHGAVYHNFSNGYGQGTGNTSGGIPAYNQDVRRFQQRSSLEREEYRDYGGDSRPTAAARMAGGKKRRGCGCGTVLLILLALAAAALLALGSLFEMPQAETGLGQRKTDTATILLCGTDKDGTRTDTMMLVYLDGEENRVGLLSLPRDTLTITAKGKNAKLNSAYGRNGCGEEGMEWTMNYVEDIIGYRPDGYILVDMELVPKMVDLMGGVDVHLDHHIRVETDGVEVYVPEGDQHLNGEEVLATLRYRYGYSNADLGRVEVQRMVITECMKQWVTPANLAKLPQALELLQSESLTNLDWNNYLWVGKAILLGLDNMTSDTLPGYAEMRGGASYFILYPDKVAALINESYNPYLVDVDADDLNIAE